MKFTSRNPFRRILFRDPILSFPEMFSADGAESGGVGGGTTPPVVTPPASPPISAESLQKALADLIGAKNNDPMAAMETLYKRNASLQTRAESAETKLTETQKNVVNDDIKAQLARLGEYEKRGTVEEIDGRQTALEAQAADGRKLRVEAISTAAGYKPILADFAEKNGFGIAQRDAKDKDDKPVKEAIAVTKGADGKAVETPLGEFLKTNYVDYLPALQKAQQQQSATRGASPTPDPAENQQREAAKPRAIGFL